MLKSEREITEEVLRKFAGDVPEKSGMVDALLKDMDLLRENGGSPVLVYHDDGHVSVVDANKINPEYQ